MKKLIAITLMALSAVILWMACKKEVSTGTIYGTVTDYATGEPVKNANVKLNPGGDATLTGSDGTYQFQDLKPGKYSLSFSKAEYADLDDDYVIELEAGKNMCRDVQMRKKIAFLRITDMNGDDLPALDFGADQSVTSKSFNIFNEGTTSVNCSLSYSNDCEWIASVSPLTVSIASGQTIPVIVTIDRSHLVGGNNSTILHITSGNGSNELEIKAVGINYANVTTSNITNVTANTAVCGGSVTNDGGSYVTDRGVCWSLNPSPSLENGNHKSMGSGIGSFSNTITGLSPNTPYHVRAYATNGSGTSYGEEKMFTTTDGLPVVTRTDVTGITPNSAVCGGTVTDNGGYAVTSRGLVWSTAQYPTLNDNHLELGVGNGSFTGSMTGLSINTTYYVRSYATNSQGTAYSEVQTPFTTKDGKPSVTTTSPTLNGTTVVTGGNVSSDWGYPVTVRGICYGTTPYPDLNNSNHTTDGTGTGYYTSQFTASAVSTTTYYIRAYATNANGTTYGEQKTVGPYDCLPSFEYGGHTYKVAPDPGNLMTWSHANSYCQNLSLYGHAGWSLPTKEQLNQMYAERNNIGDFYTECTSDNCNYWSSSGSSDWHYSICFGNGSILWNPDSKHYRVRPIRMDD